MDKQTLAILKNYSNINQGITVKDGNVLETISIDQSIYSRYTLGSDDTGFPREFSIYDLNGFLSVVSIYDEPTFKFEPDYIEIGPEGEKFRYFYSEPSIIDSPPETINFPDVEFSFFLGSEKLIKLLKFANVSGANSIKFAKVDDMVVATTFDRSGASDNDFTLHIDQFNGPDFEAIVDIDKLKVIGGSYTIGVKPNSFIKMTSDAQSIEYFIIMLTD